MPVEVGVCLGQSPPSYEWKAYQTAMFDMHSHQSVDYRKQSGLYKRQRSISHIKSDKLIGQVITVLTFEFQFYIYYQLHLKV